MLKILNSCFKIPYSYTPAKFGLITYRPFMTVYKTSLFLIMYLVYGFTIKIKNVRAINILNNKQI